MRYLKTQIDSACIVLALKIWHVRRFLITDYGKWVSFFFKIQMASSVIFRTEFHEK